ncbi:MAG: hypothetical protein KJO34_19620 [Deltaproteobacteria bacterium]|nr:hypothetical protein [Deltaproteobacteria bacterium]
MAILRGRLSEVRRKVRQYRKAKGSKKEEITFTAEDNVLQDLLAAKVRLRAHVHKIDDIDKQLGTLANGKWASFICWRGDPFDLTNYPVAVYGEGNLLYSN